MHAVRADAPVSIARLEGGVKRAEGAVASWTADDAAKGQTEGPKTTEAKAALKAAREALAAFKRDRIDPAVARQPDLGGQGIRTFDELDARLERARETVKGLEKDQSVKRLTRKIASLERDIRNLEGRIKGEVVFELVHILKRPVGEYQKTIPEHLRPSGGSWRKMSNSSKSFTLLIHEVSHGNTIEDWTVKYDLAGIPKEIKAKYGDKKTTFDVTVTGSCEVTSSLPPEKISGQGGQLDARTEGAIRRIDKGAAVVGRKVPSVKKVMQFSVSPWSRDAKMHFFMWNTLMNVTYVYERKKYPPPSAPVRRRYHRPRCFVSASSSSPSRRSFPRPRRAPRTSRSTSA